MFLQNQSIIPRVVKRLTNAAATGGGVYLRQSPFDTLETSLEQKRGENCSAI